MLPSVYRFVQHPVITSEHHFICIFAGGTRGASPLIDLESSFLWMCAYASPANVKPDSPKSRMWESSSGGSQEITTLWVPPITRSNPGGHRYKLIFGAVVFLGFPILLVRNPSLALFLLFRILPGGRRDGGNGWSGGEGGFSVGGADRAAAAPPNESDGPMRPIGSGSADQGGRLCNAQVEARE